MGLEAEASPSVVPSTTSGAAPVANEVKAEVKSDDLPDAPMLEPIKEMPTLASAGPNVEMTLEKMPAPEQSAGDDEGGNESGAVAEENSIEHQLNAAKSWGNTNARGGPNANDYKPNISRPPNQDGYNDPPVKKAGGEQSSDALKSVGDYVEQKAKLLGVYLERKVHDVANDIVIVSTGVIMPVINQSYGITQEGIHEGSYTSKLNWAIPYELNDWKLNPMNSSAMSNDAMNLETGKKYMRSTTSVVMMTIPIPILKDKLANKVLGTVIKGQIKTYVAYPIINGIGPNNQNKSSIKATFEKNKHFKYF